MIGHTTISDATDRRLFDRRLFKIAAILFPLIVLAGFGRTYYLRGLFNVPPLPSVVVHMHGLLMSAWVALFVTQVWLISSKQIRVHQRLGYAGVGLALLILPVGFLAAVRAAKYGSPSTPPGVSPLGFLIVPLVDLLMFTIFFGAAIYYRKKPAQHKMLMLLTAINFIPPAIARIPIPSLQALGPLWFFGLPTVLALFCVGVDARRRGKVNPIFLSGTLLLIASYVGRLMIMPMAGWLETARWLTGLV
jgi:hypothetical protein